MILPFLYFFFQLLARSKIQNARPAFLPQPSCGAETQTPPNFKNISLGFANPPFRKIASQNRVRICIRTFRPFPLEKLCASHRGASARGKRYSFFWKKVRAKCIIRSQKRKRLDCSSLFRFCESTGIIRQLANCRAGIASTYIFYDLKK